MPFPARTKPEPLTREEAIEILNSMPFLVATSDAKLLPEMFTVKTRKHLARYGQLHRMVVPKVISMSFTVACGRRSYTFVPQPFVVIREISKAEFKRIAPWACVGRWCYQVSTD